MKKLLTVASCWLALSGCKTTSGESGSQAKAVRPGAQGLPIHQYDLLASVGGSTAKAMFAGMQTAAVPGASSQTKTANGSMLVACTISSGLPRGAQGFPTAQTNCKVNAGDVGGLPPGVQGLPNGTTILSLGGTVAAEFYEELNVPETSGSEKRWFGAGELSCANYTDEDSYYCELKDLSDGGGIPGGAQGLPVDPGYDEEDGDGFPPGAQGLPIDPGYDE
jgi:hypothetical protein